MRQWQLVQGYKFVFTAGSRPEYYVTAST